MHYLYEHRKKKQNAVDLHKLEWVVVVVMVVGRSGVSKVCRINVASFCLLLQPNKRASFQNRAHNMVDRCIHTVTFPKTGELHTKLQQNHFQLTQRVENLSISIAIFSSIALYMLTLWKALKHNYLGLLACLSKRRISMKTVGSLFKQLLLSD